MSHSKCVILCFLFVSLISLSGCIGTSMIGSKSEIIDQNYVFNLKYVDTLPLIIKTENNNINVPEADTINSHFKKELNSRNLFQIVNRSELNEDLKNRFFSQGAFLLGEITYFNGSFGEINAKLVLKFVEPSDEKVIFFASHDTYLGNSYFLPPNIKEVTEDAIKGVLDELQNKLKK